MAENVRWITAAEVAENYAPIGGGGGGGELLSSGWVTLTNDEVKTLPTTGITLVAAQGANTIINPVSAIVILDTSAGGYTGTTDASWTLMVGTNYLSSPTFIVGPLDNANVHLMQFAIPAMGYGQHPTFDGSVISDGALIQEESLVNQPLKVKDDWAGLSDYTGGNAANSAKFLVYYTKITLP